ncbi:Uncharacterised protein [Anaerostipes hadrus]|uniref:Uncharacterized protein n=1 Tax=Anaerostipes hadrus TaxID=649756 RepID=A0A174TCY1_ANAHA|nr:hypothetical protein [Anaerostipes hadrus]CUQ07843.1 Uncharacterised protein [Anaerostipes hadrus]
MKKKKVVRMLKEMQKTVYNSDMFEKAGPQQKCNVIKLRKTEIKDKF